MLKKENSREEKERRTDEEGREGVYGWVLWVCDGKLSEGDEMGGSAIHKKSQTSQQAGGTVCPSRRTG